MKSQVLHTVWCHIPCEAAGEFWHWSLSGVKGLNVHASLFLNMRRILYQNACLQCWKQTNGPNSFSLKLVQVARSEIEMKNFTNPGLAKSGFEELGPGHEFSPRLPRVWYFSDLGTVTWLPLCFFVYFSAWHDMLQRGNLWACPDHHECGHFGRGTSPAVSREMSLSGVGKEATRTKPECRSHSRIMGVKMCNFVAHPVRMRIVKKKVMLDVQTHW